jgi:RNA polymerase sigma-70 factor (ECF subfamily)
MAAEDIVMDSFMHYWEHRNTIGESESPLPYILTTIRNSCLNNLKAQRIRKKAHGEILDISTRVLELQISSLSACDPKELFTEEARQIVARAIAGLPEQTREVFLRSMFRCQSYKQIIAEMNVSFSVVDHEMRRAKKILSEKLKKYRPDLILMLLLIR